jgi:hypothetical protein
VRRTTGAGSLDKVCSLQNLYGICWGAVRTALKLSTACQLQSVLKSLALIRFVELSEGALFKFEGVLNHV